MLVEKAKEGPMTISSLGKSTWSFLHSMSFGYPKKPTEDDKETYFRFMQDFSKVYPCVTCRMHLQKDIKRMPPKLDSRKDFAVWMCRIHNEVIIIWVF